VPGWRYWRFYIWRCRFSKLGLTNRRLTAELSESQNEDDGGREEVAIKRWEGVRRVWSILSRASTIWRKSRLEEDHGLISCLIWYSLLEVGRSRLNFIRSLRGYCRVFSSQLVGDEWACLGTESLESCSVIFGCLVIHIKVNWIDCEWRVRRVIWGIGCLVKGSFSDERKESESSIKRFLYWVFHLRVLYGRGIWRWVQRWKRRRS